MLKPEMNGYLKFNGDAKDTMSYYSAIKKKSKYWRYSAIK